MKKILFISTLLSILSQQAFSQQISSETFNKKMKEMKPKFGLKAGYNIAFIYGKTPNFSPKAKNGFTVSGFYSPSSNGLGYRTEIIFSRQGFSFADNGKTENVTQDYIYMPHLTTFTIAKRVQLQAGGQISYLLNAKKESSSQSSNEQIAQYMNRFDYGAAVGLEIYPFKDLIIGGRYNISMGNPYKNTSQTSNGGTAPMPFPLPVNPADFKGKNAVIQFFLGYRF